MKMFTTPCTSFFLKILIWIISQMNQTFIINEISFAYMVVNIMYV